MIILIVLLVCCYIIYKIIKRRRLLKKIDYYRETILDNLIQESYSPDLNIWYNFYCAFDDHNEVEKYNISEADITTWGDMVLNYLACHEGLLGFLLKSIEYIRGHVEYETIAQALMTEDDYEIQPVHAVIAYATFCLNQDAKNKRRPCLQKITKLSWYTDSLFHFHDLETKFSLGLFDFTQPNKRKRKHSASIYEQVKLLGNPEEYEENKEKLEDFMPKPERELMPTSLGYELYERASMRLEKFSRRDFEFNLEDALEEVYRDSLLTNALERAIWYSSPDKLNFTLIDSYIEEQNHKIKPIYAIIITLFTDMYNINPKDETLKPIIESDWFKKGVEEKEKFYKFLESNIDFMDDEVYYEDSHANARKRRKRK